jgi:hypothetical protein
MNVAGLTKKIVAAAIVGGCVMSTGVSLSGCMTDDTKDSTATVEKHTPFGAETTVPIGAQGNLSIGSAVDLDNKTVMLSNAALAAQGTIDLVFVFADGDLQLMSPVAAKAAGIPLAAGYDASKIHDTQFGIVSTPPEDSEAGVTIFAGTPKVNDVTIFDGAKYLVKTDKGKLALITITDVVGDDNTASAKLTISLSGL